MKRRMISGFLLGLALPVYGQEKEQDRVENAGKVMKEILNAPDSIPQSVLDKADCVVVLPSVHSFSRFTPQSSLDGWLFSSRRSRFCVAITYIGSAPGSRENSF